MIDDLIRVRVAIHPDETGVYEVHRRHLDDQVGQPERLRRRAMVYGNLIAACVDGEWRTPQNAWTEKFTDPKAIRLLESYPMASTYGTDLV